MIILINGSINAGKTTVSRQIATLLPSTAHVEVDDLRAFIWHVPLTDAIPINLENAVCVTRNFVRHGFHVVLSYPLSEEDHAYLLAQLSPCGVPIHTFTLSPALAVAVTNRGERELTVREVSRIHEQYQYGVHLSPFGERIDNSTLSPEETAMKIFQRIQNIAEPHLLNE